MAWSLGRWWPEHGSATGCPRLFLHHCRQQPPWECLSNRRWKPLQAPRGQQRGKGGVGELEVHDEPPSGSSARRHQPSSENHSTATNRPSPATTSWGEGTHETKVRADLSAANKSLIHIGVWITGYQLSFFDSFCFFLAILTDDIWSEISCFYFDYWTRLYYKYTTVPHLKTCTFVCRLFQPCFSANCWFHPFRSLQLSGHSK